VRRGGKGKGWKKKCGFLGFDRGISNKKKGRATRAKHLPVSSTHPQEGGENQKKKKLQTSIEEGDKLVEEKEKGTPVGWIILSPSDLTSKRGGKNRGGSFSGLEKGRHTGKEKKRKTFGNGAHYLSPSRGKRPAGERKGALKSI